MEQGAKEWQVKDSQGRVFGPYSKQKLLDLIAKGFLEGEESVALQPDGQWVPISKVSEFYDALLAALADGSTKFSGDLSASLELEEPMATGNDSAEQDAPPADPFVQPSPGGGPGKKTQPKQVIIDLKDEKVLIKKEKRRKSRFPLLIILAVVFLGLVGIVLSTNTNSSGDLHLVLPKFSNQESLSQEQVAHKLENARRYFQRDTFDGYLKAQNGLVELIEGAGSSRAPYALLCLTYRELWPYAFKDEQNLSTLSQLSQRVSQLDALGTSDAICRIVQSLLEGKRSAAHTQIESFLGNRPGEPIAYELKAEQLIGEGKLQTASSYLQKAQQLWPNWLKVFRREAEVLTELGRVSEAKTLLVKIIQNYPKHDHGRILLGILEIKEFKNIVTGRELLQAGTRGTRAPPKVLGRGFATLAQVSLSEGDEQQALEFAQKSFAVDPTNINARAMVVRLGGEGALPASEGVDRELFNMGESYRKVGDYLGAQAEYKAAFEMNPKNAMAALRAGQMLWELGQGFQAIEWTKKAIAIKPELVEAYVSLSDFYSARFEFDNALGVLRRAQKMDPKNYKVFRGFAQVELRRNNPTAAVQFGERALKIYDTDVESHLILVQALFSLRQYRRAYQLISRAIELDRRNVRAQALYSEVLAQFQGVGAGVRYATNLVNTYAAEPKYRMSLARIYAMDDQLDLAIEQAEAATKISNGSKESQLLAARLNKRKGNLNQALSQYLYAAAKDPSDGRPLLETGIIYMLSNKHKEALHQFKRTLEVNASYPRAHYYTGLAQFELGNYNDALKEAKLEARKNPRLPEPYLLAGRTLIQKRQYSQAVTQLRKAAKLAPGRADVYVLLSRSYRLMGSLELSGRMLNMALSKESGNAEVYKEQGALFERKGDISQAIFAFRKYLQLKPNAADRVIIDAKINKLGGM